MGLLRLLLYLSGERSRPPAPLQACLTVRLRTVHGGGRRGRHGGEQGEEPHETARIPVRFAREVKVIDRRRVVVTGLGAVTPLGNSAPEFWRRLAAGDSGIAPITAFDPQYVTTKIAGEVKGFDPDERIGRREARRLDRFAQLGLAAAKEALEDSKLEITDENRDDIGSIIATGIGGILTLAESGQRMGSEGPQAAGRVSPFFVPMLMANAAAGTITITFGVRGPAMSTASACASSNNAIGEALRKIQYGEADVMFAGGAEAAINPMCVGGFCSMKAMSTRNDEPGKASRPFDRDRDGFVLSEGAAVLVLEELESAQRRGAHIYAELTGYGVSSDAFNIVQPEPEGAGIKLALQRTFKDAGIAPADVQYINAHATSTPLGDTAECKAIREVWGAHAERVAVSSTKGAHGHALGAAGALEAVATVMAVATGIMPPTINLEHPDPECDLDFVPNVARKAQVDVALSNSFGFGGHNAVLAFGKYR
ncbi:MAG: beta-ketoacyl-ACP synthase II [bacterium]|nr:beta-ketoacyl-ACP synthase II [bacterium]